MQYFFGSPFRGRRLEKQRDFLRRLGLDDDAEGEFSVLVEDDGAIVATGSRYRNVLKCIGATCKRQGEGLTAGVVTELVKNALENGYEHLFLYTKPGNRGIFESLSFHAIVETADVLFMENRRDGIEGYLRSLHQPMRAGMTGAVVANANPFTLGHQYLIETAASRSDFLHVFILSEDRSAVPAPARLDLARQCLAHLDNVTVHPTGDYLISTATFPGYFIKDKTRVTDIAYGLDLAVFAQRICPALRITKRFVGDEPDCAVTDGYNAAMLRRLPGHDVAVEVIPRKRLGAEAISASRVRALLASGNFAAVEPLVPPAVAAYLRAHPPVAGA